MRPMTWTCWRSWSSAGRHSPPAAHSRWQDLDGAVDPGGRAAADGPGSEIFRAYDIRGLVDRQLTPETLRAIGQAIGSEAAARGRPVRVIGARLPPVEPGAARRPGGGGFAAPDPT